MKLEDQVCSLEQAKKLGELGIEQKSLWYWEVLKLTGIEGVAKERITVKYNIGHPISDGVVEEQYAAFTVAELGIMLQAYTSIGHSFMNLDDKWAHTWSKAYSIQPIVGWYSTEARARAGMLILLLEQKLVTISNVNNAITA